MRTDAQIKFLYYPLVEMKKILGRGGAGGRGGVQGTTNYEVLSATMVGQKFFISNCLKRLEKLNICGRQVVLISIVNRCLLRNYLESVHKVFKFLGSLEVRSLGLKS